MENQTKEQTMTLSDMRAAIELAAEDGQRINSSDSNAFVAVLSEARKAELLDILKNDYDGKEKNLDECIEKLLCDGIKARLRSIEYSRKTKNNAAIAAAIAECKTAEDVQKLLAKMRAAEQKITE